MTALLPAPVAAAPAPPPERPRRRWAVVVAALPALAGLAWSALLLWAPSAVDLRTGPTAFGGSATVVTVPEYGPRGTDVVDYRDGTSVELTVPVRNAGPLPVTITSAITAAGVLPLLEVQRVDGLPLRVGAGETADLRMIARLTNCKYYHEREVQNVRELALRVDSGLGPLSRVRDVRVALERPLLVHSPMIVGCPDRTLDRQANDRTDGV